MKSPYIGDLAPNEQSTGFFLCVSKDIRQRKTGEPYLALTLADRTGEMEARMWDNVAAALDVFDRDDFVKVQGLVQPHQNRLQFIVQRIRKLEDHEIEFEDFFPCSDRPVDEMWRELMELIDGIQDRHLSELLRTVFADERTAQRFRMAPAAKSIHHACRGGLIEHVLSLCGLCRRAAAHYPEIDIDLLLTGAVLHDIGKIDELSYARSFSYTVEGQLLGHILIGLRIIDDAAAQIPDFPPKLKLLLQHMIASHHGELEFGSPKVPQFAEALMLHYLDNLDSKMGTIRAAIKRDLTSSNEFTGWVPSLERAILKKERWLASD